MNMAGCPRDKIFSYTPLVIKSIGKIVSDKKNHRTT